MLLLELRNALVKMNVHPDNSGAESVMLLKQESCPYVCLVWGLGVVIMVDWVCVAFSEKRAIEK